MKFRQFIAELQRRNVFKAVVAYLAVAWMIIQIASIILPAFEAPDYVMKVLIALLIVGLVFWAGFSWIYDLTPQGIQKTESADTDVAIHSRNSKRLNRIIVSSLVITVLLLISASFWAGARWTDSNNKEYNKRIAVIPFEIIGNQQDSYFQEGMTESLIDELSKVGPVTVLSLASSRHLTAGFNPTDRLISEELKDMDYFIYGTLEQASNLVKVHLKASESIDGLVKWEKRYAEDVSKTPTLWAEIAAEVGKELGITVDKADKLIKAGIKPVNPETYELYLKGKYFLNKSTVEDWQRGIVYLQEAIDQNAADPYAYAGLAEGYISLGHNLMPPPDVFPKALAASKRAIQLDSTNAEGWAALAHYHTYFGWDWELAEYAFEKADELNPNMAYNHYHRAWFLALFGRMDEAIAEHKRAQEIDPFSSMHTAWLAELYRMVGEYDKGIEEADRAAQMQDDNALSMFVKGRIYIDIGQEQDGLAMLKRASEINSGWKYMGYGPALFQTGHSKEGNEIINELEGREQTPFFSLCLGIMHLVNGNLEQGFEWLQKAKGHGFYPWIRVLFMDDKIRKDPRFLVLLKELGLPDPSPLIYDGEPLL